MVMILSCSKPLAATFASVGDLLHVEAQGAARMDKRIGAVGRWRLTNQSKNPIWLFSRLNRVFRPIFSNCPIFLVLLLII